MMKQCKRNLLFTLVFLIANMYAQEIQWAYAINYDSEITNKDQFNARMATGAPDAKTYGGLSKRCATANNQKSAQLWLDLKTPQEAKQILILENNACGNIVKVELLDEDGTGTPVYEKPASPANTSYRLFSISMPERTKKIKTIKIKISGAAAKAEPQIDAVGIVDADSKFTFEEIVQKYNTNKPEFAKPEDAAATNYEVGFDKKNINVLNVKRDMNTLMIGLKPGESGNLGGKVNSVHDEIAPIISPDEKTLFMIRSGAPQNYFANSSEDIWYSEWNAKDTCWGKAEHMGTPFNNNSVNKVVGITPDGTITSR